MLSNFFNKITAFDIVLIYGFLLIVVTLSFIKLSNWAEKGLTDEEKQQILNGR